MSNAEVYAAANISIFEGDEDQVLAPAPRTSRQSPNRLFHDRSKMLKHVFVGAIFIMYVPLIGFVQVKFQNGKQSPFETDGFFMITSMMALLMATVSSGILFYKNENLQNSNMEHFSVSVSHTILVSVVLFTSILAPLSLVLVLLVPPNLHVIGYSIIGALFAVIVLYDFGEHIWSLGKKMLATWDKYIEQLKEKTMVEGEKTTVISED